MHTHETYVVWNGKLETGEGRFELGSGALSGTFDSGSRFGGGFDATPEELLGTAHAACFTMALVTVLEAAGLDFESIETRAEVKIQPSHGSQASVDSIDSICLHTRGCIPGIDGARFKEYADAARSMSMLSQALAATSIRIETELSSR